MSADSTHAADRDRPFLGDERTYRQPGQVGLDRWRPRVRPPWRAPNLEQSAPEWFADTSAADVVAAIEYPVYAIALGLSAASVERDRGAGPGAGGVSD